MKRIFFPGLAGLLICSCLCGQFQTQLIEKLEWREIGPYRGGRSCAVTGVSGEPNLFYFGSTGGGVWESKDGGRSWKNISDGFFGGSVGAIAVAESDPNVIYVGGGEKTVRGNVSFGYGIMKSTDKGKTWEKSGLEKSRHISRIRVHPKDHDIVFAAVMGDLFKDSKERGIYKSTDGGKNWKKVLYVNDKAGAVDLILDPNNPRIMYASSWNIRRTPYSLSSGGEGSTLWKSTDSGESWMNISDAEGLPEGTWGISAVAVSPKNSERVWCLVENEEGGIFRSDDAGKHWRKLNGDRSLRQRAWYYTRIYADPGDEDGLYVVNVDYHRSKDGGKTFSSFRAPHGDHHDLWIDPENADRMIIGDDGGAQVSYDRGETWSTYHNQPTAQFYRVTTDDHFPYRIYGAQQDNSTVRILSRTTEGSIGEEHWEATAGGESAHIAIDPENNDIVYGGSYGGYLTRLDHNTGHRRAVNVWPDNPMGQGAEDFRFRFQWNFPIFFSRHDPDKLYAASNHLHLTTDEGQSWTTISPDLTRNDPERLKSSGGPITQDNTGVEYYCTIFAAEESPVREGLIWVGSDDGLVHITRDGGANWENVTPSQMPEWMMINCIDPSPHDEAVCYIAGTRYKSGDYTPYLYKTSDYGKNWTLITAGIEKEHFTRAIRTDLDTKGLLYAGTESGMYISHDDGNSWSRFQLNLPLVPITDLALKDNDLIAATQGRGFWVLDDLDLVKQSLAVDTLGIQLFRPEDVFRMNGYQVRNPKGRGTNHYTGLNVHFYLPSYTTEQDTVELIFLESTGDTIRYFSSHSEEKEDKIKDLKRGANLFNWDLRYPKAKDFDKMILWSGSLAGPKAKPGSYRVRLIVNGKADEKSFTVKADPRLAFSARDYNAQFDFIQSVNTKLTETHELIGSIREIKKQMANFRDVHKHEEIGQQIAELDSILTDIEKNLYQTKNQSRQDPLNFPIRLNNKLAHLNSLIQISDGPPTNQMYAVRDELSAMIDKEIERFNALKSDKIRTLNKRIAEEIDQFIK